MTGHATGDPGVPVLDRAGEWREDPHTIDRLRADEATGVLVVRERRVPVDDGGLLLVSPADPVLEHTREWALLGRRADGSGLLLALQDPEDDTDADGSWAPRWADLREAMPVVDAFDAELLVVAIALAGWLRDGFCPTCGGIARLRQSGWSRRCENCGREHFPRTDPAIIVAVQSRDGERLLLGANAQWKGRMHSCFAGFVEAGESLEATVHRELAEEAGVRVTDLAYFSSQPWPFPRSLMVGFHATAADEASARGDGEEIIEVRWLTRAEIGTSLAGEGPVALPGTASIAHRLILDWYRR
ncbi:NAD(+) diphosphatase [uncultured Microbacterium sp.]|uniref:NAD(+) diphosphatase n=1 Tax=uncultured Microbacterium sp. TaxID=191216 RepID=UPI0025FED80E|nr:NAD(+) diphosphatase [uncultured Microbacterium sp.]